MTVVADTGPLLYLILIRRIELIPALFDEVVLPSAVRDELCDSAAPAAARAWAERLPDWASVGCPTETNWETVHGLDRGEAEAILLAKEIQAERLLVDELKARRRAEALGLRVAGTLGILLLAGDRGLTNVAAALDDLEGTNFRLSASLREAVLRRASESIDPH